VGRTQVWGRNLERPGGFFTEETWIPEIMGGWGPSEEEKEPPLCGGGRGWEGQVKKPTSIESWGK